MAFGDDDTYFRPYHPLADTTCAIPAGVNINVYSLNFACGYEEAVDDLDLIIRRHENMHQWSLNQCIRTANQGKLWEVEALVGDYATVDEGLKDRDDNCLGNSGRGAVSLPGERAGRLAEAADSPGTVDDPH